MIREGDSSEQFVMTSGGKAVKVTVTFPVQTDKEAQREFAGRLKEVYEGTLTFPEAKDKESRSNE